MTFPLMVSDALCSVVRAGFVSLCRKKKQGNADGVACVRQIALTSHYVTSSAAAVPMANVSDVEKLE